MNELGIGDCGLRNSGARSSATTLSLPIRNPQSEIPNTSAP
jgi:hypothetical protein